MGKIALVEDDDAVRELYKMRLESNGHEVRTARNGVEGLALIESFGPDIVLLDLMMPEMSGEEMLTQLRTKPWGTKVKVLIMTNLGEQGDSFKFDKLGIEAYIIKAQYTLSQLSDTVTRILTS